MSSLIVFAIICSASLSDKIVVRPDTVNPHISTELISDPRGYNEINFRNKWRLRALSRPDQRLKDWALTLDLDAETFGFAPHSDHSEVSTELRGFCTSMTCDTLFALQIGDNQMVLFQLDLLSFNVRIYPKCGGDVMTGLNANDLIKNLKEYPEHYDLADALYQEHGVKFTRINTDDRWLVDNLPASIQFINDDINNKFTIKFNSDQMENAAVCSYNAVDTQKELKLFMTPGWKDQNVVLGSLVVSGDRQKANGLQKLEYFEMTHDWESETNEKVMEQQLYNKIKEHILNIPQKSQA